jgi:FkbM family methyltransferase
MHPQFWLGDVRASTPDGRFECRGGTTDFDIVNTNYETGLIQAVRERLTYGLGEPMLVVDVGAHIGKYAILAGRLLRNRGKVIAIEADPDNFRVLENNVALNGLTNVRCMNVGCWNIEGTLMLHRARGNLGGHSFVDTRGGDSIAVPVRTLDSILREQGINRIDLMKIDVERGEFRVLQGARSVLESSPDVTLFFEESGDSMTSRAVRLLVEMEFNVRRLGGITYIASRSS